LQALLRQKNRQPRSTRYTVKRSGYANIKKSKNIGRAQKRGWELKSKKVEKLNFMVGAQLKNVGL